jgi:hypothetical protein
VLLAAFWLMTGVVLPVTTLMFAPPVADTLVTVPVLLV